MKGLISSRCLMAVVIILGGLWISTPGAEPQEPLPGTKALTVEGNLSAKMLEGLHRFAERKIDEIIHPDYPSSARLYGDGWAA